LSICRISIFGHINVFIGKKKGKRYYRFKIKGIIRDSFKD